MYELSSKFVDIGKLCCDTMEFELFMFTNDTEQMHVFNINRRSLLNINKPPEYNAFSAVRYRNTLFAVGGSFNGVYESFGLKYDFEEKEWSKFECPVRKKRPGVCIIDDKLYIAGGFSLPGLTGSNEFSCYNLQTGQLIDLPSSQESRASPGVVCYKSAVYVFGGIRDESFVGFYDPREGTWHNAGQIPSKHPGCTATLVENTIYWKDWYYSLYSYEPRQCSVRIEREFSEFGTITSCDNGLYIALQNSGIYEFIRENKMLKICRRKFKEPFILGYME
ncbi:kelch-like protein 14 [Hermetia illucens]|uniref:kelch-like protein 14 n=1 Tax=Hermetia illucens TaxID=343691 RepID=UPI0018CC0558|nr:kelch-like protein 14 [Hermetia illucens]